MTLPAWCAKYANTSYSRRVSGSSTPCSRARRALKSTSRPSYRYGGAASSGPPPPPPQERSHTRQQLGDTEWFRKVVVGSQIERPDLVALTATARKHQHRGLQLAANRVEHLQSIGAGEIAGDELAHGRFVVHHKDCLLGHVFLPHSRGCHPHRVLA